MAEEFTFQASEIAQPSKSFEPAEFSFSAEEIAPKVQNTEMEHFRIAQKALAQSPQWKSGDATQKKRLMANLQDTVFGGGYSQAQQKSEYQPESFAKGLGRKAIRYTGATLGGLAGGLAAAPTVIGVGPGATAGAMAGYGVGKAAEEALLGQEHAPPAKERVFKGGTLRQGLAEAIYNVPESAGNLAEGAIAFPSALGKAAMTPGGGEQVIKDTAHMFTAPFGVSGVKRTKDWGIPYPEFDADIAKDAWVLDPAGAALAPTMIAGGLRGLKGKGRAEPKLDQYIAKKYPNAVGMTSAEMRRSPDIQKHLADAQGAIKTITALKDEGLIKVGEPGIEQVRLPKNRLEFSDAIHQAKGYVFGVYNALKQKAGESGAVISLDPIVKELSEIASDPVLKDMKSDTASYADRMARTFAERKIYTPEEAQRAIQVANDSYKDFLKNPSPETGGKARIDAIIGNNLRRTMENVIDSEVGPGWQAYRNKYKQLSTIEKEVTKGAVVDARKSPIGILDFTDMFSAGEAVSGIISMNPAQFAKGGTMFMIKRIYRKLKDPNTAVDKMFRMTDKHYKRPDKMSTEPWIPKGPPEPPPLDTSFNPETVPGRQSSQMIEIPGSMAKNLEEGGSRFEPPALVQREQTIANPEQLPGTSYRQETIDPNAVQVITRQKTVENPEQLPGKQSGYTDQEMVPQGNTNVDLMSMSTKLKELGFTDEQISEFVPKAMKAGAPIAAVTAYLVADDETKKRMLQTLPMLAMIDPYAVKANPGKNSIFKRDVYAKELLNERGVKEPWMKHANNFPPPETYGIDVNQTTKAGHTSPHIFTDMDIYGNLRTGEGATYYGPGHYSHTNESIKSNYTRTLTPKAPKRTFMKINDELIAASPLDKSLYDSLSEVNKKRTLEYLAPIADMPEVWRYWKAQTKGTAGGTFQLKNPTSFLYLTHQSGSGRLANNQGTWRVKIHENARRLLSPEQAEYLQSFVKRGRVSLAKDLPLRDAATMMLELDKKVNELGENKPYKVSDASHFRGNKNEFFVNHPGAGVMTKASGGGYTKNTIYAENLEQATQKFLDRVKQRAKLSRNPTVKKANVEEEELENLGFIVKQRAIQYAETLPNEQLYAKWDKPLTQQPKYVQDRLRHLYDKISIAQYLNFSFGDMFKRVTDMLGSDVKASRYFESLGLAGWSVPAANLSNPRPYRNFITIANDLVNIDKISSIAPIVGLTATELYNLLLDPSDDAKKKLAELPIRIN